MKWNKFHMSAVNKNGISAWYCVILFSVLYSVSLIDRYILSLLAPAVSSELHISDKQIGLLLGAGFAIVYATMGLPVAHVIDRWRRIPVVAVGVLTWSLATISAAFAQNFEQLALSRAGVAIGEAVLTPAAISLIADLFSREKRGPPVAVYSATSAVMSSGGLIIGGAMLSIAPSLGNIIGMAPWRTTMILVGAPGILLSALLILTVREPKRAKGGEVAWEGDSSLGAFVGEMRKNWRFYLPLYLAVGGGTMYPYGIISWGPTILVRIFGVEASASGYLLGLAGIPPAVVSAFVWPWISGRLSGGKGSHAMLTCLLVSAVLMLPAMMLIPLVGTALMFAFGLVIMRLLDGSPTLGPLTIQNYGPGPMRGRLMALYVLSANVLGMSGGSFLVPFIADFWAKDPRALTYGLVVLGVIAATSAILGFWLAGRAAAAMVEAV
jgi:MFS family permease